MTGRRDIAAVGRRRLGAVAALAFGLLAGCAAPGMKEVRDVARQLPARAQVASVPFFPQEKYQCGPAALAMTLAWTGLPVTQNEMISQVYTPGRRGTFQSDILSAARRNGRLAVPVNRLRDIVREIAAGHPVLVFQNLGLDILPQWHYAVVVGYDLRSDEIVLHSGTDRNRATPLDTFARTWTRGGSWALVVLPPGRLPATAAELPVLRATAALERSGSLRVALASYESVIARWPDSFGGSIGLGNARYALGDFNGAASGFARAIQLRPASPAAWNNFAHALSRQGRKSEAIAAARRALEFGGPESPTYRATLAEVSRPTP